MVNMVPGELMINVLPGGGQIVNIVPGGGLMVIWY